MYSGTTFNHKSGNIFGVHQKIDKAAYRLFLPYAPKTFPALSSVLHFEGKNGPDGVKGKTPSKDEPWHFIDPHDDTDKDLIVHIANHQYNLKYALQKNDEYRVAFEAAWLAHAVVDGLTPAHHYPLEDHLEATRGEGLETRNSIRKKLLIPGDTKREKLRNNWEFWGAKGVMTTHFLFELGVAGAITPFPKLEQIPAEDLDYVREHSFAEYFRLKAKQVAALEMYETFSKKGWTTRLGHQTRKDLVPMITYAVALAWLDACS